MSFIYVSTKQNKTTTFGWVVPSNLNKSVVMIELFNSIITTDLFNNSIWYRLPSYFFEITAKVRSRFKDDFVIEQLLHNYLVCIYPMDHLRLCICKTSTSLMEVEILEIHNDCLWIAVNNLTFVAALFDKCLTKRLKWSDFLSEWGTILSYCRKD